MNKGSVLPAWHPDLLPAFEPSCQGVGDGRGADQGLEQASQEGSC
jgi:hypothetical protein